MAQSGGLERGVGRAGHGGQGLSERQRTAQCGLGARLRDVGRRRETPRPANTYTHPDAPGYRRVGAVRPTIAGQDPLLAARDVAYVGVGAALVRGGHEVGEQVERLVTLASFRAC